jgi:UDP-N-acetyl-2-amino-2-deoxyglucuronate dehydrogenase
MVSEAGALESRTMRVALIGCGRISTYHMAALKALHDVEVVAVCDLDERAARETAAFHGIRGCYTDPEPMLRDTRPDAGRVLNGHLQPEADA